MRHGRTTCVDSFRRRKPRWSPSTFSPKHFGIELSRCVPRFCRPPNQARATSADPAWVAGRTTFALRVDANDLGPVTRGVGDGAESFESFGGTLPIPT